MKEDEFSPVIKVHRLAQGADGVVVRAISGLRKLFVVIHKQMAAG